MSPKSMAEAWAEYEAKVIPADAGAVQRRECKKAFYSGAHSLVSVFDTLAAGDTERVTPEDLANFTAILRELDAYFVELLG